MNIMTREIADELLSTKGYIIHQDYDKDHIITYTTCGLSDKYNKFELQLKFNFDSEEIASNILDAAVDEYLGRNNIGGTDMFRLPKYFFIKVVTKYIADKNGNVVIRIIIPDNNENYPWNNCSEEFKNQWNLEDDDMYGYISYMISRFGDEFKTVPVRMR